VYNGQWFSSLRESLQAFIDVALSPVTGMVTVELWHGHATAVSRTSAMSLYQAKLASFDMTGYDAKDSAGFIRLFGLPLATAARRDAANGRPVARVAAGSETADAR
jgi:argininosuccinate synthase